MSQGYTCQKALRLDYYQNGRSRVTRPLRRRADGTFEEISWETAVAEIAARIKAIRKAHGGHAFAYYGGGGQGNHLGGAHSGSLRVAMGTRYVYTALAQEKTGGFWVDGKLFGDQACHPTEDVEHADFLMVIGANPWQSHGFPKARQVLQEIAKDPRRTLVVVDPRRTETAERADIHLAVRPGGDAHLMLAMLGTIVQEGLFDREFLEKTNRRLRRARRAVADDTGRRVRPRGGDRSTARPCGGSRVCEGRAGVHSHRSGARAFTAQHAQHVSLETALPRDRAFRQAGHQRVSHDDRPPGQAFEKIPAKGAERPRSPAPRRSADSTRPTSCRWRSTATIRTGSAPWSSRAAIPL